MNNKTQCEFKYEVWCKLWNQEWHQTVWKGQIKWGLSVNNNKWQTWKTNERPSADPIIQRDTRDNIRILMDTSDDTGIQRQKDTEGHTRWYKDIEK